MAYKAPLPDPSLLYLMQQKIKEVAFKLTAATLLLYKPDSWDT